MKLESTGILIGLKPFGERDCIAHVFTRDFGILCGMLKGAQVAKKKRPLVGHAGAVAWNARLDSQLGTFHFEAEKNLAAKLMADQKSLSFMNAAFALIAALLPEREKYDSLYDLTLNLLLSGESRIARGDYLDWEKSLLQELGYALDIGKCCNCGCKSRLNYLSPKTGRAVCDDCARPFADKLLRLPIALSLTRKFLEDICASQGATLPWARRMLRDA
ncbi:MAG: DNA repair protein RecO [Rickettsiales bacterium]|jgi:DNA repair protein RecO (recombination protein O)|nr:DNA repair protein RecO [Rickettsiales bacterium]